MKTNILKAGLLNLMIPVVLAAVTSSCATAGPVPNVLLEARASMATASAGMAANLAPRYLDDAKQMLERANREFATKGADAVCLDYSYIAQNKIELADVMARAELERKALDESAAPNGAVHSEEAPAWTAGALASAR
jgi:hypothetical protein